MASNERPNLADVRNQHYLNQDVLLAYQYPATYSELDIEVRKHAVRDMNGLDVLTVVIRQAYLQLKEEYRGMEPEEGEPIPDDLDEIRRDEARFPLLLLAWADLADTEVCRQMQNIIRHDIVDAFLQDGYPAATTGMAFRALTESDIMLETLWKRRPFQLYRQPVLSQPLDRPETWSIVTHPPPPSEWARSSLVTWNCRGNLGGFISAKFGCFTSRGDNRRYYYQFNEPAVIRVLCQVPKDSDPAYKPPTFNHIRTIRINGAVLTCTSAPGKDVKLSRFQESLYSVIAVVRLRDDEQKHDLIRTYMVDGPKTSGPADFAWQLDDWKFGTPGTSYMVYYSLANDRQMTKPASRLHRLAPEVPKRPNDWELKYQKMMGVVNT
ncbi:hypothetical protein F5B20DRAFT_575824 [Whalleya microplaca]|nr:hypothetical protein F5B20DRAFT_575824 [Whalleya microplaca]